MFELQMQTQTGNNDKLIIYRLMAILTFYAILNKTLSYLPVIKTVQIMLCIPNLFMLFVSISLLSFYETALHHILDYIYHSALYISALKNIYQLTTMWEWGVKGTYWCPTCMTGVLVVGSLQECYRWSGRAGPDSRWQSEAVPWWSTVGWLRLHRDCLLCVGVPERGVTLLTLDLWAGCLRRHDRTATFRSCAGTAGWTNCWVCVPGKAPERQG